MSTIFNMLMICVLLSIIPDTYSTGFKHIRLDTDQELVFETNAKLLIECPVQQLMPSTHLKRFRRSAVITSWFKNDKKINQFNVEAYSGNENGRVQLFKKILKIKSVQVSDSGMYRCEVISGSGINVHSHTLTMSVNDIKGKFSKENDQANPTKYEHPDYDSESFVTGEAPVFQNSVYESSFTQLELTSVYFDCSSAATPTPNTQWLKNDKIISEEDYGLIRNIMQLNLKSLQPSDSGNYTCQVSNQFGKLNRTFTLKVLENLKFVGNDPVNQTVLENNPVVIKCSVEQHYDHFERTLITWYIHESNVVSGETFQVDTKAQSLQINGDNFYKLDLTKRVHVGPFINNLTPKRHFKQLQDNSLLVNSVQLSDEGFYVCFANNSYGYNYRQFYVDVVRPELPSNKVLVNLFKGVNVSVTEEQKLSLPMIAIIVTASVALVVFIGLLYCYKNI